MRGVITKAREQGGVADDIALPHSTVHRLLASEGLMVPPPQGKDRRRFAFHHAGECWQSDVMHGPKVGDGKGKKRKSYLIATLDDATRVIPYAAFDFSEDTGAFLQVLRDWRRGLPQRLYVDNGANYRSRQLALVCARLGIALVHATPYSPAGKGKIERWFRTCRSAFLAHLDAGDLADLETLNRRFRAWVEAEYHYAPHRGLDGLTPFDKWALVGEKVRQLEPGIDLDDLFLFEVKRRVSSARTVSLNTLLFEVDASLQGKRVTLRYDPKAPPKRPIKVVCDGKPAGEARLLDIHGNAHARRISFRSIDDTPEDL